ncbi:MAG: enoyl-CoA hydratase-related protein, partial [Marinobacter sp.]|nr:enoyl-CoA hydratase-related protein [Marinobacter sp.]
MTDPILKALSTREVEFGPWQNQGKSQWNHWHLARDDNSVAWLLFDKKDASANVLSVDVLEELSAIINELETDTPNALVLRSVKASGFCMGADISEFESLSTEDEAVEKLTRAHEVIDRFEALKATKIAIVHGACLGGGLELALTCDYRFAIAGA